MKSIVHTVHTLFLVHKRSWLYIEGNSFVNQKKSMNRVNHRFHWLNQLNGSWNCLIWWNYIIWFIFNEIVSYFDVFLCKNGNVSCNFSFWWNCSMYFWSKIAALTGKHKINSHARYIIRKSIFVNFRQIGSSMNLYELHRFIY